MGSPALGFTGTAPYQGAGAGKYRTRSSVPATRPDSTCTNAACAASVPTGESTGAVRMPVSRNAIPSALISATAATNRSDHASGRVLLAEPTVPDSTCGAMSARPTYRRGETSPLAACDLYNVPGAALL